MDQDPRTPVVLLAGLTAAAVGQVAEVLLRDPGTAVAHHDLRQITQGVVRQEADLLRPHQDLTGPAPSWMTCNDDFPSPTRW